MPVPCEEGNPRQQLRMALASLSPLHRNGPTWAAGMSLDKAGFAYQALDGQRPGCPRQSHLKISDMEATPGGCAGSTGPATAQPGESLHCDPRGPMLPPPSPGYPVPRPGRCGIPGAHAEGCRRASRAPRPPGVCQRRRPVAMRGPGSQSQDPLWGQYRAEIGQIASGFAPFDSHPEPDRRVSGAADGGPSAAGEPDSGRRALAAPGSRLRERQCPAPSAARSQCPSGCAPHAQQGGDRRRPAGQVVAGLHSGPGCASCDQESPLALDHDHAARKVSTMSANRTNSPLAQPAGHSECRPG